MLDQISFTGFKEFVRSKSGNYDYFDEQNCAMGQYLQSLGHSHPYVGYGQAILDSTKYKTWDDRSRALTKSCEDPDPNVWYFSKMFPELVSGENKEGQFMWDLRCGNWELLATRLDKIA